MSNVASGFLDINGIAITGNKRYYLIYRQTPSGVNYFFLNFFSFSHKETS
jgi:hypothetical protein